MRRVHWEATELVGANRLGWNSRLAPTSNLKKGIATECAVFIGRKRNAWEPTGLDGTADGNEAWRT